MSPAPVSEDMSLDITDQTATVSMDMSLDTTPRKARKMPKTVEYIRTVPQATPKRTKSRTGSEDLGAFLFRNRAKLSPYGLALALMVVAHLLALSPVNVGPWLGLGGGLAAVWVMFQTDLAPKLNRARERQYAAVVGLLSGVWLAVATCAHEVPAGWTLLVLLAGTTVTAGPWWYHRRIRGRLPVFVGDLVGADRRKALRQSRAIVRGWRNAMGTAQASGTTLRGISFDRWSVSLEVTMDRSMQLGEFRKRCAKLETALDGSSLALRRDSARVEGGDTDRARSARVRFMLKDPHAEPIRAAEPTGDTEWLGIGLFETGAEVLINLLQHILIAGRSGAGKSVLLHLIIWTLSRIPWVAIVGIDMKPGAPELGRWERSMFKLGKTADDAGAILTALRVGLTARGDVMAAKGWQKWRPDAANPWIVLVVDEAQGITQAGLDGRLADVAALLRAYGGTLVLATQYPVKDNLPTTVKEQIVTTIGLKTKTSVADRVIFGENADKEGWVCSKIPGDRKGSFYIESDKYEAPLLARAYYLDEDDLDRAVATAPAGVQVDTTTWPTLVRTGAQDELEAGEGSAEEDVWEAEEMPTDPEAKVLWALGTGSTHRTDIETVTGFTQKTVDKYLGMLIAQGRAVKVGPARYARKD